MEIRALEPHDEEAGVQLWTDCGLVVPWNVPKLDIERKLAFQPELFFVSESAGKITGSVMAGYEGHRGWINYLAVDPALQSTGLGRELMELAESKLRELGCPKINLQVRGTNTQALGFYERLGFKRDDPVSLGKRLDDL